MMENSHIPHFSWWCRGDITTRENFLLFTPAFLSAVKEHSSLGTRFIQHMTPACLRLSPFCWIYNIKLGCFCIYLTLWHCRKQPGVANSWPLDPDVTTHHTWCDSSPNICLPPPVCGLQRAGGFWPLPNYSVVIQGHSGTTTQYDDGTEAKNGSF